MSLLSELSKQKFLHYALSGLKRVMERELEIKNITVTLSETTRHEIMRKSSVQTGGVDALAFPYAFLQFQSLAATRDQQNSFAARKVGQPMQAVGTLAYTKKAFLFPFDVSLEFHYVHNDPDRLLEIATALGILSSTNGLSFRLNIGPDLTIGVRVEVPQDFPIGLQEEQSAQLPEASEIVATFIIHCHLGFTRDVSAVNGSRPVMNITVTNNVADAQDTYSLETEI